MAGYGVFRRLWLTRFSKPAGDRQLYRHLQQVKPGRIVELGIGGLDRTERVLRFSTTLVAGGVQYVGLDRFEARLPAEPVGATLKQAHQRLHALARVQLVPGNADTSLARLCNHLGVFDMVLIGAVTDERHLERCWFFIQRITKPGTVVLREVADSTRQSSSWQVVAKAKIDELASRAVLRRAA